MRYRVHWVPLAAIPSQVHCPQPLIHHLQAAALTAARCSCHRPSLRFRPLALLPLRRPCRLPRPLQQRHRRGAQLPPSSSCGLFLTRVLAATTATAMTSHSTSQRPRAEEQVTLLSLYSIRIGVSAAAMRSVQRRPKVVVPRWHHHPRPHRSRPVPCSHQARCNPPARHRPARGHPWRDCPKGHMIDLSSGFWSSAVVSVWS
mmetsp:Transcript_138613/g.360265  ORF Transcript_138613/g.360265 Transcript_138613/m.360265 type:complete len:202 (-) Transcript_138613:348-953(-)